MNSPLFIRTRQNRIRLRSQAFVEFAMILPIFLTLMCGVIDYGYMIGNSMALAIAARESANAGARQVNDNVEKGLRAAVDAGRPRLKMTNHDGGVIVTRVVYRTNDTVNAQLISTDYSLSFGVTGRIYGGGDSLRAKTRILPAGSTNWASVSRRLPFPPTVLEADIQKMTIAEVFYTNSFVTPIGTMIGMVTPPILYDIAFF